MFVPTQLWFQESVAGLTFVCDIVSELGSLFILDTVDGFIRFLFVLTHASRACPFDIDSFFTRNIILLLAVNIDSFARRSLTVIVS